MLVALRDAVSVVCSPQAPRASLVLLCIFSMCQWNSRGVPCPCHWKELSREGSLPVCPWGHSRLPGSPWSSSSGLAPVICPRSCRKVHPKVQTLNSFSLILNSFCCCNCCLAPFFFFFLCARDIITHLHRLDNSISFHPVFSLRVCVNPWSLHFQCEPELFTSRSLAVTVWSLGKVQFEDQVWNIQAQ